MEKFGRWQTMCRGCISSKLVSTKCSISEFFGVKEHGIHISFEGIKMSLLLRGFCLWACMFFGSQLVGEQIFEEGVHFKKLPVPVQTQNADKIEVIEIFSYGCVHCYSFDPQIELWRSEQSDDVNFRRIPAVFSQSWEPLARAFYAAQVLGVGEKVHMPIFTAIHQSGVNLQTAAQIARLFNSTAGVDEQEFISVFNSFGVRSQVQQAGADSRMYRITGVPTLVVAGKYVVDGVMAGNNSRMLQVVDFLVQQERVAAN